VLLAGRFAMMQYIDTEMLGPRAYGFFVAAVIVGYFAWKWTKHTLFGIFMTIAAVVGAGFATGMLTTAKTKAAWEAMKEGGEAVLDSTSANAKLIGEQAHATSAGSGGETNKAYKKNIDNR
jgi:hypothetical protein